MEIKDITRCAFMAPDPKLLTVDFEDLAKRAAEHRAKMEKANPPKQEGPAEELRKLRRELFSLEQCAMNTEINTNNKAGNVKLLAEQLNTALAEKKHAATVGNLRHERSLEHTIARLEGEVADAEKEFNRARKVSAEAARALKEWPHRERVKELQKIVG